MGNMRRVAPLALLLALGAGCGAGQYGFAREYVPLGSEEGFLEQSTELGYEEVRREVDEHGSSTLGWFGVVSDIEPGENGQTLVHLTYRTLATRNLCSTESSSSCRVTVSERPGGVFHTTLTLRPEDREGQDRLWRGSLLRVYGTPAPELLEDGTPVIVPLFYRHWPRGAYVTTGARRSMRR